MAIVRPVLRVDAWEGYAAGTRVDHFAAWCEQYLKLGQSQWAGRPLVLEASWQRPIMAEAMAVNPDLTPYWKTVALVIPRKCAKTTTLGAFATYQLAMGVGDPEILLAAGSDKQADKLYRACTGFVRRSPELREMFVLREYIGQISRVEGDGTLYRLSNEGDTQHGANPSLVVIDELHVWRTPTLRRSWGALTTADGARNDTQVFTITTEGEAQGREDSILGELVDGNEGVGDVERVPGLTISRDHESRTLVFHYHAVSARDADPRPLKKALADLKAGREPSEDPDVLAERLLESVMPATPASWITDEYILGQAKSSKVMPSDFLQLHACIAAESRNVWISADSWDACEEAGWVIPDGEDVYVSVDASFSHDSTAVAWCSTDGSVVGGMAHVWSARAGSPAHEFVEGGQIRMDPVVAFISDVLHKRWRVAEIVYDPKFFDQPAQHLSDLGFMVAAMYQGSVVMRGAEQVFHDAVMEQKFKHGGDPVLSAHVAATVAERTEGGWKIRKVKNTAVIDATVAMVMAHDRAARVERFDGNLFEVLV